LILKHILDHSSEFPVILIGDLNTELKSQAYQFITKELRDVFTEIPGSRSSHMVTFHNYSDPSINHYLDKKAKWIDYIFLGKTISIPQVRVIKDYYSIDPSIFPSDHWPLFAELDINEGKKE
jgi:endonuclease/exonuclease/phosphatase family metal-dependent hydrolase